MSETATAAPEVPVIEKRVSQFIQLRDRIKAENDAHALKMKPLNELLQKLNAAILDHLNTSGGDSLSIRGVGTAYKTMRVSASIQDGDEFRRWIIGGEAWDLIDWKANAKAIEEYNAEHGALPPGVKITRMSVVGVRRDNA